jgi:putative lipoprotein
MTRADAELHAAPPAARTRRRSGSAALVLLAALGAALPAGSAAAQDAWLGRDKALHFGVSAGLAAAAYGVSAIWLERPAFRALVGASAALTAGAAKEVWDAAGHGDPSAKDFTWDLLGAVTGTGLSLAVDLTLRRWRRKRAGPQPAGSAVGHAVIAVRAPPIAAWRLATRGARQCPSRSSSSAGGSEY